MCVSKKKIIWLKYIFFKSKFNALSLSEIDFEFYKFYAQFSFVFWKRIKTNNHRNFRNVL